MNTLAVYDSAHPLARKNQCFDESEADTGCGHSLNVQLYKSAKERGIEFVTADEYLSMTSTPFALCVTDMFSPYTEKVLEKGAIPAVCCSMESPIVAKRYYHHIKRFSGRFHHSIQFLGTRERLRNTGTVFHTMYYPVEKTFPPLADNIWQGKKYLALINSNKRSISRDLKGVNALKTIAKNVVFQWWKFIDPWMRAREIYVDRIKAIRYFSKHADFHLFGEDWDKPIAGFGSVYQESAHKSWKNAVEYREKKQTLNEYRFSICFENCSFPGYITEKLFDCFQAGCIPVYLGAPDVADFIPKQSFVDFRDFQSFQQLDEYLQGISEETSRQYLDAAYRFLQAPECERFYNESFVNTLIDCLDNLRLEMN